MLPEIDLRDVSREDVDRIAGWLYDNDVSSNWFGHYACGDPVHRGYDPVHMLEAPELEWDRIFRHDPSRLISSIYNVRGEHIGESRVVLDNDGAEVSLLIGRKDLWHMGYGTSVVMTLLDKAFNVYRVDRAWVSVPEDNIAVLGLFKKLVFVRGATRRLCKGRDGVLLNTRILEINAAKVERRRAAEDAQGSASVVTVTGLPGSGAEAVGTAVARMTGLRLVDDELGERLSQRLRCSIGEMRALEGSYRSLWSRLTSAVVSPWERYPALELGYEGFDSWPLVNYDEAHEYLTKERYLAALKGVVRELAAEGDVVIHGHGCHLFVPSHMPALRLLVTASQGTGLGSEKLRRAEWDSLAISRNLFGANLLDTWNYDMVLNLGRLSIERAAQLVVGAIESRTQGIPDRVADPVR